MGNMYRLQHSMTRNHPGGRKEIRHPMPDSVEIIIISHQTDERCTVRCTHSYRQDALIHTGKMHSFIPARWNECCMPSVSCKRPHSVDSAKTARRCRNGGSEALHCVGGRLLLDVRCPSNLHPPSPRGDDTSRGHHTQCSATLLPALNLV